MQAHRIAHMHGHARRQPRLDLPMLGVDGDDLRGTKIFSAENAAAHGRGIREPDVLGTHTQHQRPRARASRISGTAILASRNLMRGRPIAALLSKCRKFIGGEPIKSATNMLAGRS